jgi:hypothetical protein
MNTAQTIEMAYPQKIARDIIVGLARPINSHLVKLTAFPFPDQLRRHFKRELRNWLSEIQAIRLKPNMRTGSFKFYFDPLFDYPFGGVEVQNMRALIALIASEYEEIRPIRTAEETIAWLRQFHTELAERLHNRKPILDLIPD